MNLSMFWAIFQSFCNQEIFVKFNLPIFVVLIGQREKSQKYIDLSACNLRGISLYILGYYLVFLNVFVLNILFISRYCCLSCF